MNRTLFIIIGIVIVFALIGVWAYILLFHTPKNNDVYNQLNLPDNPDNSIPVDNISNDGPKIIPMDDGKKIKQLTLSPVVGFQEVDGVAGASSTPSAIYYIEAGVGHIFSIDLATGEEKRVSATTFPSTQRGVISFDGRYALIHSGTGAGSVFTVGEISSTSDLLTTHKLNENIIDFTTTADNTFLYLSKITGGLIAKEYNPKNKSVSVLFQIPFSEAKVIWGQTAKSPHYVYPKTNDQLEGYVYKTVGGSLKRLPLSGFGLSAIVNGGRVLYTVRPKDNYETGIYSEFDGGTYTPALAFIPDKCVALNQRSSFLCASYGKVLDFKTFENWYSGNITYDDDFWEISATIGASIFAIDVTKETGQELDITNPQTNPSNTRVYFQNKNDQTLWLYRIGVVDNIEPPPPSE